MIPHESFTYGLNGGQYKFVPSSSNVKKMLKPQSLDQLTSLWLPRDVEEQTVQQRFKTEDVVTVTKLKRVQDAFGRPTVNNKTVIIRLDDYLMTFPPVEAVKELLP